MFWIGVHPLKIYIVHNYLIVTHSIYRAQAEEYDYEKDEDDPISDEEAEMNEKQSECDNSINLEDQPNLKEDNISINEMNMNNKINKSLMNLNKYEKDFAEIMVDVVE